MGLGWVRQQLLVIKKYHNHAWFYTSEIILFACIIVYTEVTEQLNGKGKIYESYNII